MITWRCDKNKMQQLLVAEIAHIVGDNSNCCDRGLMNERLHIL